MALVTSKKNGSAAAMNGGSTTTQSPVRSSPSSTSSNESVHDPDKPIGYGAFGVVWSVTDPRDNKRVALKKLPNVFTNVVAARRVYRELTMLTEFKHDNIIQCFDILQPADKDFFQEIYLLTELMQSDLHRIIVSPQALSEDHVKVFMYQILRGLKYLHSANIIHRDVKPGNLLVNGNCMLKICDFGLARVEAKTPEDNMTQEVVTQYYRAPEILLGAKNYTSSIDIWSAGCIFVELMQRKILFQCPTPLVQLEKIVDVLGTPSMHEIRHACAGAKKHMKSLPYKPPQIHSYHNISKTASFESNHLLMKMLVMDPSRRATAEECLSHHFLEDGRLRYHSCMCTCCLPNKRSKSNARVPTQLDKEPTCERPFPSNFDADLNNQHRIREKLKVLMVRVQKAYGIPLCLNPNSSTFKQFQRSGTASAHELPPSPHRWAKN